MNFTREPIVESIITPREGCKLVVRNSKAAGQEEYFVDAIEIVSFGSALFFRSLERPKNFLVPVTDYEVLEVRETRMMLKAAVAPEKPKKAEPSRPRRKKKEEKKEEEKEEAEPKAEKKKERRRRRRRKGEKDEAEPTEEKSDEEAPAKPRATSALLPPPTTLISESIGRYKEMTALQEEEAPPLPEKESAEGPALPPPQKASPEQVDATVEELGVSSASRFIKRLAGEASEETPSDEK